MLKPSTKRLPSGKLYLVATPIGNLGDITFRAVEILRSADVICAEDTRRARILLDRYEIVHRPVSYHEHNAQRMALKVVEWVRQGQNVALISDAGTPAVSDPGFRAVRAIIEAGLPLEAIPGPTAVTTALVLSGLGVDRFVFEGFLPVRKGRRTRLEQLADEKRTIILFESPHKLAKTLGHLAEYLGSDRLAVIARELTKIYEEVIRDTLGNLLDRYQQTPPKGEIVIVVEGLTAADKRRRHS
ncbi:MAG: 16S rRNA (cytidine(1402)-2'-O)-methyltransferase [Candidatus Electryoneaceae bacterium]|nr:16S rRNA (cytidine(1402)-2'-O)-methyltransferase [Candidatus Electryoneaceae bacterium]